MTRQRSTRRRRGQALSLTEMLLAVTLGMLLLSAAYQLLHESTRFCHGVMAELETHQEIRLVRHQWRRFIHSCPDAEWRQADGGLRAGTAWVRVRDGTLLLTRSAREDSLMLPAGGRARLSVEKGLGRPDRVVLTLFWESRILPRARPHRLRLVACPGGLPQCYSVSGIRGTVRDQRMAW